MEKTETKTKEQLNEEFSKVLGGAMITVQVELFEPFVRFAKDYQAFFGNKDTFEIFCMKLIYDNLNRLHWDLTKSVENKKHILDGQEWFEKHPHLATSQTEDEEETKDC